MGIFHCITSAFGSLSVQSNPENETFDYFDYWIFNVAQCHCLNIKIPFLEFFVWRVLVEVKARSIKRTVNVTVVTSEMSFFFGLFFLYVTFFNIFRICGKPLSPLSNEMTWLPGHVGWRHRWARGVTQHSVRLELFLQMFPRYEALLLHPTYHSLRTLFGFLLCH